MQLDARSTIVDEFSIHHMLTLCVLLSSLKVKFTPFAPDDIKSIIFVLFQWVSQQNVHFPARSRENEPESASWLINYEQFMYDLQCVSTFVIEAIIFRSLCDHQHSLYADEINKTFSLLSHLWACLSLADFWLVVWVLFDKI